MVIVYLWILWCKMDAFVKLMEFGWEKVHQSNAYVSMCLKRLSNVCMCFFLRKTTTIVSLSRPLEWAMKWNQSLICGFMGSFSLFYGQFFMYLYYKCTRSTSWTATDQNLSLCINERSMADATFHFEAEIRCCGWRFEWSHFRYFFHHNWLNWTKLQC